jgi:hypothetical protein
MLTTKSLSLCFASVVLTVSATVLAVLTPVTDDNRRPMAAFLVGTFFVANPALLIAAGRASD